MFNNSLTLLILLDHGHIKCLALVSEGTCGRLHYSLFDPYCVSVLNKAIQTWADA